MRVLIISLRELNPAYKSATETPNIPRVLVDKQALSGAFTKANLSYNRYFSLDGPRAVGNIRENKRVIATRTPAGKSGRALSDFRNNTSWAVLIT